MRGDLSAPSTKYNSAKVRGSCELCKEELAEEIHHLQEQHLADDNGRIGSIHKNHPANLMGLCGKCHQLMHQIDSPEPVQSSVAKPKIIRKKTTKGYVVVADTNILDVKNT
jgi:hypothetical protein